MSGALSDDSTTRVGLELGDLRAPARPTPGDGTGLRRGDLVDRYVIVALIGTGGGGEVYRAYDPDLERNVAIKLLTPKGGDVEQRRAELLREARALARLGHPNVVQVFDVGVDDHRLFLTMELLEGSTMRRWNESPHTSVERAKVLLAAGRGLSAAHDAGLLHRDFKPSNVIVTSGGRVCVCDFGLAHRVHPDAHVAEQAFVPTFAGTPPYLAPEIYDGAPPTIASDVFAFGVTAWEILFGERPWPDVGEPDLLGHKRRGAPSPPRGVRLPRGLIEAMTLALAADPRRRSQGLAPLLRALDVAAHPRRRRAVVAALAAGLVVAGGAWLAIAPNRCANAGAAVDEIWNDDALAAARRGLLATDAPFAADVWARIEPTLASHAEAIRGQWYSSCVATYQRGEQSESMHDRRTACLERRRRGLAELLQLYAKADRDVVERATAMVAALDPIDTCEREQLEAERGPTRDPAIAIALDRAAVLEAAAHYTDAMALCEQLRRETAHEPDGVDHLEVEYQRARLLERLGERRRAGELLEQIHWRAEATHADSVAARAAVSAIHVLGALQERHDEALAWVPHARAAIERAGGDEVLVARLLESEGTALLGKQDGAAAVERYREALVIRERRAERSPLGLLSALNNIAVALEETHAYDQALAVERRALDLAEATLGEAHPYTALCVDNIGTTLVRMSRAKEGLAHLERAMSIRRAAFGPRHPLVALSAGHLGLAHLELGQADDAVADFQLSLELSNTPEVSELSRLRTREGLAHALAAAGRTTEASAEGRVAHEGLRQIYGDDHPEVRALAELLGRVGR